MTLPGNRGLEQQLAPTFWQTAALLDEKAVLCVKAAGAHAPPVLEGSTRESWAGGRVEFQDGRGLYEQFYCA